MKHTLLALLLVIASVSARSQSVSYSATFPRLKGDAWQLFQNTNGNTFLINVVNREGMFVALYDSAHQFKVRKPITGRGWDTKNMEKTEILAIYEINGDVVMFVEQEVEKEPCLFRVIIDAQTAMIKDNRKIASHSKYGRWEKYALSMGGSPKAFHIVKDASSSCYAVASYDNLAPAPEKSPLILTHYDGNHNEISKASLALSAEDNYKFLQYLGMVVDSTSNVYLATYAFDTRGSGGKRSKMFFSKLTAGNTSFVHQPLELTENFKQTEAALRFHKQSGKVKMLLLTLTESKSKFGSSVLTNYYNIWLASVDAATLKANYFEPISTGKIDDYNRSALKATKGYGGLPQNFIINDDGSASISFEQASPSKGRTTMLINDMAVLNLTPTGEGASGYVVRKQQDMGMQTPSFTQFEREKNYSGNSIINTQYYSYDLVNAPNAQYIIYNDRKENFARQPSEDLEVLNSLADLHTVCYRLKDGKAQKAALFDDANENYEDRSAHISSSNYLPANNTYAVVLLERYKGREWKSRIAWVKFE